MATNLSFNSSEFTLILFAITSEFKSALTSSFCNLLYTTVIQVTITVKNDSGNTCIQSFLSD